MDPESVAWPTAEPSYRLRPPAADETATVDALAAVLDATPRQAVALSVRLAVGRQIDAVGPGREALEALSGHDDVTVADDHTVGTLALTAESFDALVRLSEAIDRAIVWDPDGVAIADLRDGVLRFALPEAAVKRLRENVGETLGDRISQVE